MKKPKVSAAIATYNEEKNIEDCLKSLIFLTDEIVVVDGSSNDETAKIAKEFGAKVFKTSNKAMFHINKNLAIAKCTGEWIFQVDADERVTQELAQEIKAVLKDNPKENGFWVNRRNWFLGEFLTKGGAYPDRVIRLIRRGRGRLPELTVHEQIEVDGEVGFLNNDLLHYADPSFSRYLEKANRYTTETALFIKEKNPGRGPLAIINYMVIKPLASFLAIYLRHKGYKDGLRGFIWALFSASHHFFAYVKYWERKD